MSSLQSDRPSFIHVALAAVAIVVVVLAAHRASLDAVFVFDDEDAIVFNPHIQTFDLAAPPQSPVSGRPLVALSLAVNHAIDGVDPWGYHAFNLLLHALNALLVGFLVLRAFRPRLARPGLLATLVACLWAVHPLQSEVVAYAIQRTESLAAFFVLTSLAAMIMGIERGKVAWLGVSVFAGWVGLGAKESAAIVPVLALLVDRGLYAASWAEVWQRRRWFHGALFAMWVLAAYSIAQGHRSESVGFGLGISAWEYLLCQAASLTDYARLVLWPVGQTIDYGVAKAASLSDAWFAGLAIVLAVVVSFAVFRRWPRVGLWAVWVFVCLGPTSTFVPIVTEVAAERRVYLALVGVIVLFVFGVTSFFAAPARGSAVVAGVLASLCVVCGWLTYEREFLYRDSATLWRDAIAHRPGNERAHGNLGAVLAARGDYAKARVALEAAVRLDPSYSDPKLYLGIILASQGEFVRAADELRWAAEHHPRRALASFWAGIAFERVHGLRRAIDYYQVVLSIDPDHASARNNLAWLLATCPDSSLRNASRALSLIEPVYQAQPQVGELRDTYAACLAATGQYALAVELASKLAADAARLAAHTQQEVDRQLAAMLEARLARYQQARPWIDARSLEVTRFQGRLRNLEPSL